MVPTYAEYTDILHQNLLITQPAQYTFFDFVAFQCGVISQLHITDLDVFIHDVKWSLLLKISIFVVLAI